jgi:hypothetical protein
MAKHGALYQCLSCRHRWLGYVGPVGCPACRHLYVRWLNYEAIVQSVRCFSQSSRVKRMSIYPDKKHGKLTGRFAVEVTLGSHRMCGRFATLDEARTAEKEYTRKLETGEALDEATLRHDGRDVPRSLSALLAKGSPLIWNGSHGLNCERQIQAIIGLIGDLAPDKVTTTDIDDIIIKLREGGSSPGTVKHYLAALHALLKRGASKGRGYVTEMPEFSWQDEDEGRIRVVTLLEEARLRDLLSPEVADYVSAAIRVSPRQLQGSWLRLWANQTKAKASRSVPLNAPTKAILKRRLPWTLTERQLAYAWNKAKAAMGLADDKEFVVHALRHTCATRPVERGVNLVVIQRYMGHKAITTTLRYAHYSDTPPHGCRVSFVSPGVTPDDRKCGR